MTDASNRYLVLSSTAFPSDIDWEMRLAGAQPTHFYGPRTLVATVPAERLAAARSRFSDLHFAARPSELPAGVLAGLDPDGTLGIAAFDRCESAAAAADARVPDEEDGPCCEMPEPDASDAAKSDATSARLIGSVTLALIVVSGPSQDDLQITPQEATSIQASVQAGTDWLSKINPPSNVTWNIVPQTIAITTPPDPKAKDLDRVWRDPVMQTLGYPGSVQGVAEFARAMRKRYKTDWVVVVYVIKYPLRGIAKALLGGPCATFSYSSKQDTLGRRIAHEIGHCFNAPDEYISSACDCGGAYGVFGQPNANCANCADPSVPCFMRSDEKKICDYTTWHLGVQFPNGLPVAPPNATAVAPSVTVHDRRTFLFWVAPGTGLIMAALSDDHVEWSSGQPINGTDKSPAAPSACTFNGKLYLFWQANSQPQNIYFTAAPPGGKSFPDGQKFNTTDVTPAAPTAVSFENSLWVFWTADDGSSRIYYSASSTGAYPWPAGQMFNTADFSYLPVAACVFNKKINLFWLAANNTHLIYTSASAQAPWPAGKPVPGVTSAASAPACFVHDEKIWLVWQAANGQIWFCNSKDAVSWTPPQWINTEDLSSAAIAACAGEYPVLAWISGQTPQIYYTL